MIEHHGVFVRRINRFILISSLFISIPLSVAWAATGSIRFETTGNLGTAATLELRQNPLVVMKPTFFSLRTTPLLPVSPAIRELRCDLTMPAMPMPPNKPKVLRTGEAFTGEMIFTMAGIWQAEFNIPLPAGKEERFVFTIDQVLLK